MRQAQSATKESIQEAKAAASRCAYCDCAFEDAQKQTDHMVALCHGGEHSLRNVVIVCRRCNGRKARLTYAQWLDRIEPKHLERAAALLDERYGSGTPARQDDAFGSLVGLVAVGATRAPGASAVGVRGRVGQIMDPQYSLLFAGRISAQSP